MFKLDLEKAEEAEIKLPASAGSSKKQENSRKTFTSALLTMPKPLYESESHSVMSDSLGPNSPVYCDPHKVFGIVNKEEIDVFLELSCFFHDPADVGT